MKISTERNINSLSGQKLRRARRLYVFLCRHALEASTDNTVIHRVGQRMVDSGLYSMPGNIVWRDLRYRIVRRLFRIANVSNKTCHWHFWRANNRWDGNFCRLAEQVKSA